MKIKGKVFVDKNTLRDTPVGTYGFLKTNSVAIYSDKLYLNTLVNYSTLKIDRYSIPFKRISNKNCGYELDFSHMSLSFIEPIEKPDPKDGWIGPFEIKIEKFSWESFYGDVPLAQIIEIWNKSLNTPNSPFEKMIRKIKRETFYKEHKNTLLKHISPLIKETKEYKNEVEQENRSLEKESTYYQSNSLLIEEYNFQISKLNEIFEEKTQNIPELDDDDDLEFLIDRVDDSSPDEFYSIAAKARDELKRRESEDTPIHSES